MAKEKEERLDDKEKRQRLEAALRGARIVGHQPMKASSDKRAAGKDRARVGKAKK